MFDLTESICLDAQSYGNILRYVNHAKFGFENLYVQTYFVKGQYRIAMFAEKPINPGEELFFDYGENFKVQWLIDFNEKIKNKLIRKKKTLRSEQKKKPKIQKDIFSSIPSKNIFEGFDEFIII